MQQSCIIYDEQTANHLKGKSQKYINEFILGNEGDLKGNPHNLASHRVVIANGVTFHHNGKHSGDPRNKEWAYPENEKFQGTFVYVNGPNLTDKNELKEVTGEDGQVSPDKLKQAFIERFRSAFIGASNAYTGENIIITIPGISCGVFAGSVNKQDITKAIYDAIFELLLMHKDKLSNVKAVLFDTYESKILPHNVDLMPYIHDNICFKMYASEHDSDCPGLTDTAERYSEFLDEESIENCKVVAFVAGNKNCIPGTHLWSGNTDEDRKESVAGPDKVIGKDKLSVLPIYVCTKEGKLTLLSEYIDQHIESLIELEGKLVAQATVNPKIKSALLAGFITAGMLFPAEAIVYNLPQVQTFISSTANEALTKVRVISVGIASALVLSAIVALIAYGVTKPEITKEGQ